MRKRHIAIAALGLWPAACAKPLPPGKAAHAGEWDAARTCLRITPAGEVAYRRAEGRRSTSIRAPRHEFVGDDSVVGVGPVDTTFNVPAPPHRDRGQWKLTVDGVELTRRP